MQANIKNMELDWRGELCFGHMCLRTVAFHYQYAIWVDGITSWKNYVGRRREARHGENDEDFLRGK